MDPKKELHFKQLLEQEIKQQQDQQDQNEHFGLDQGMNQQVGELSGYDNHPADLGTEMFERGKDLALNEANQRHQQEVKTALAKMDEGTYGICEVCQSPISEERLEAVPWARTCLEHQVEKTASMRRPVEEKVLKQIENQQGADEGRENAWVDVERYGTSNPPDFFRNGENYNELTIEDDER